MPRLTIGSVNKPKDPLKPKYIQISKNLKEPVVLHPGQFINVESKADQLANLDKSVASGRLSPEQADKIRDRVNKIPDWVLAELVVNT